MTMLTLDKSTTQALKFLRPLVVLTALVITLCVTLYVVVLLPARDQLAGVMATYDTLRQEHLRHLAAKKTQGELTKIWKQLPAKIDFTSVGVSIAKLAKSNQVSIPGMGYDLKPTEDGLTSKGSISFEVSGAYESIRKFIYQLETTAPYLFVEKLAAERSKKPKRVAFKIMVGTFFQPAAYSLADRGQKQQ